MTRKDETVSQKNDTLYEIASALPPDITKRMFRNPVLHASLTASARVQLDYTKALECALRHMMDAYDTQVAERAEVLAAATVSRHWRHWPRGSAITVAITVDGDPPKNGLRARVEEMRLGPDGVATHVHLTMRASEASKLAPATRSESRMESSGEPPERDGNG